MRIKKTKYLNNSKTPAIKMIGTVIPQIASNNSTIPNYVPALLPQKSYIDNLLTKIEKASKTIKNNEEIAIYIGRKPLSFNIDISKNFLDEISHYENSQQTYLVLVKYNRTLEPNIDQKFLGFKKVIYDINSKDFHEITKKENYHTLSDCLRKVA